MSDLALLLGPLLVGAYLNAILYGVLVVQAYNYFTVCKRDTVVLRSLVVFILIAETVSVWADFAVLWEPLVTENGSARALEVSPVGLRADPIVTSAISTAVEIYMGLRIRRLTSSRLLFGVIVFFAVSSFVGGISSTIVLSIAPSYSEFPHLDGPIYTWLLSSAVADVIIAVSLVIYLMKNKGNSVATDTVLKRIIRMTVQTGALTSVAAIADFLTFAFSESTVQFIWDFSLGKLYTISLLSGLNARIKWQQMLEQEVDDSFIHFETRTISSRTQPSDDSFVLPELGARYKFSEV